MRFLYVFVVLTIFCFGCNSRRSCEVQRPVPCCNTVDQFTDGWWTTFNDSTLNQLIDKAVAYNHDLKAAKARIYEARAMVKASTSALLPDINVSGTAQKFRFSENGIFPIYTLQEAGLIEEKKNFYDIGFDACWEIDIFGVNRNKVYAAHEQVCQTIEGRNDLLITLTAEVSRYYIILRQDQQLLAILHNRLSIQREIIKDLENKRRTGLVSELDVSKSKTMEKEIQGEITAYDASIRTTLNRLAVLSGMHPRSLDNLLTEKQHIPKAGSFDPSLITADIILHRPDVKASQHALKSQAFLVRSAKGKLMPNIWLFALYRLQSMTLSDLFSKGSQWWFLGPFVNWRLFERYELQANLNLENARFKRACEEYCQQILVAYEEVESTYNEYNQSRLRHQYHQEALVLSENTVTLTENLYKTGLGSYGNYLEAKAAHNIQEENATKIEAGYIIQKIRLHKSLGG